MSKGSKPRPLSVERDTFADRWAQTFGARRELTAMMKCEHRTGRILSMRGTRGSYQCILCGVVVADADLEAMYHAGALLDFPAKCPTCEGEGRDPDHHKNACPECGGDGKLKEAA